MCHRQLAGWGTQDGTAIPGQQAVRGTQDGTAIPGQQAVRGTQDGTAIPSQQAVRGTQTAGGESVVTHSPEETLEWGAEFARNLQHGDVVALAGELGAGKTILAKGICAGLGFRGEVISPSFVRIHKYSPIHKSFGSPVVGGEESRIKNQESRIKNQQSAIIYHVDFYLVESRDGVMDLGLEELYGGENIVILEWAQKFPDLMPEGTIWVDIELGEGEMCRTIKVTR